MSIFTESFKRKEKEDIQKGIRKGIRKGIEEGKIESARKMLAEGFEISIIQKITGLSHKRIEALGKRH